MSINPKMQFMIYTLEFDVLSDIKNIFEQCKITRTEAVQITISKTDKNGVLITEPVSYTHLDVYKRQYYRKRLFIC